MNQSVFEGLKNAEKYNFVKIGKCINHELYVSYSAHIKYGVTVVFHVISPNKNFYVEWETKNGPITDMRRAIEPISEYYKSLGGDVMDNYFFEKTYGRGNWTQLAVDDMGLKRKLYNGDYLGIKIALERYLQINDEDETED